MRLFWGGSGFFLGEVIFGVSFIDFSMVFNVSTVAMATESANPSGGLILSWNCGGGGRNIGCDGDEELSSEDSHPDSEDSEDSTISSSEDSKSLRNGVLKNFLSFFFSNSEF